MREGGDYLKTETINQIIKAYEENDLAECESKLFFLLLLYNTDIRDGKYYDHDLKHALFKTNCVRNPIGMKYTSEDYEKTRQILIRVINLSKAMFFASTFWRKMQNIFGECCISKLEKVAKP